MVDYILHWLGGRAIVVGAWGAWGAFLVIQVNHVIVVVIVGSSRSRNVDDDEEYSKEKM